MKITLQDKIRAYVMDSLGDSPATIADIAAHGRFNYETVRVTMRKLQHEGLVTAVVDHNNYRNVKWTAQVDPNAKNSVIPFITAHGRTVKLLNVLKNARAEIYKSPEFFSNFPRHVTRLMTLADKAHSGTNINIGLKTLRMEMERDYELAKEFIAFYEQVLKDPRNWNPDTLRKYPNDEVWNAELLEAARSFYFQTEAAVPAAE